MNNSNYIHVDEIRDALKERNLSYVSNATGLNPHTIYRFINGKVKPNKSTINLLKMYLQGRLV